MHLNKFKKKKTVYKQDRNVFNSNPYLNQFVVFKKTKQVKPLAKGVKEKLNICRCGLILLLKMSKLKNRIKKKI